MKNKNQESRIKNQEIRKQIAIIPDSCLLIRDSSGGMTLVEILVAMAIFIAVMIAVTDFEINIFSYNTFVSSSFQTTQTAQNILKTMLTEIRDAAPGANGAFPIVNAGSTTISFFSDTDNNGTEEQVTYTLTGTNMYRAVIQPAGSPPSYNPATQSTTTIFTNVRNGTTTPVFEYFDNTYNGTSSPLTQPVTTTSVSLVKINMVLDIDPLHSPLPVTYTVQVGLRNLKTNL